MEINPNLRPVSPGGKIAPVKPAPPRTEPARDVAELTAVARLERALSELPDARPEAVERARTLVKDPGYPSRQIVDQIAGLLAQHLANPAPSPQ